MSFFASSKCKFEDIALETDSTPTKPFLDACTEIVLFFDVLGSTAFSPVKSDIHGNIAVRSQSNLSDKRISLSYF
jgi:pleckstrin family protein A (phosphoinositide binding specific) protein 8